MSKKAEKSEFLIFSEVVSVYARGVKKANKRQYFVSIVYCESGRLRRVRKDIGRKPGFMQSIGQQRGLLQ